MRMTTYLKTIIIHFTYCMREKSWEAKWLYYTVTNLWFIQTCGQWSADDNHSFVPSMYNLHSGLKFHKTSSLEISPHGVWIVGFLNIFFFKWNSATTTSKHKYLLYWFSMHPLCIYTSMLQTGSCIKKNYINVL